MSANHVLYEDEGAFRTGTILSEANASLQVEQPSGRRAKVKASHVLLRFGEPLPGELLVAAQRVADAIDVDFLWECAPQEEFGFADLAAEYFGHAPSATESAALLLRLQAAPVYFHRKGRGRYRPAPPDTLRAALAGLEKRRQQEARIAAMTQALRAGVLPSEIAQQAARLLARPDRNALEWKALDAAADALREPPERLLLRLGAFPHARAMHRARFEADSFPAGTALPALGPSPEAAAAISALPLADVQPFSIDDSSTTEIDDCLSVVPLPAGGVRIGIHIAAPALGIAPGDALDRIARERMSTVYMPGDKIQMLPEPLVRAFSLDEGCEVPALSLYVDTDAEGREAIATTTRLERIRVAANLRHDRLEDVVTEARLVGGAPPGDMPFPEPLRALWRFTLAACARREKVRGKPEPRFRTDFAFAIDGDPDSAQATVRIVPRRRDSPLDRIVAEMAILANSEWGALLARHGVPGIYRSQQLGRVRMTTHPVPHQGLGVAQYIWATSPLRRFADLVNQRQLVAVLAGRPVPHPPNDSDLFSIISAFDARYAAYAAFQSDMERAWCLRWLEQSGAVRVPAVVVREGLARLADAPFVFRLADAPALAPGRRIEVDVLATDEVALTLEARFVAATEAGAEPLEEGFETDPEGGPELPEGDAAEAGAADLPAGTAALSAQPDGARG